MRKLTYSVAFYSKFATFITFRKLGIFFGKNPLIFHRKHTIFESFWDFLLLQWPCSVTLLLLAILKKSRIFFENPIYFFFKKKPNFERFEKSYSVGYILHQIGCFQRFLIKLKIVFSKNQFFSQEKAIFSKFWEIWLIQLHPTTNFLSLADIKKVIFFEKTHKFYLKKTNFEQFENFYSFSRIVQQICYL